VDLASRYDIVCAGVGLHPMDLREPFTARDREALHEMATSSPKVVCISETGLDFLPTSPDRLWQDRSLREHIRLARELGKPLDFHAREAYDAILPLLREEKADECGAIWHYFEGGHDKAREALAMGFYLSLAKPLLRLPELQEVAKGLPLDRLVLETDSYPQPWKKNPLMRTVPAHVAQVAAKVAELKAVTIDEVAAATTANLRRALRLP
jgi:TatD DNase family protein